MVVPPLTEIEPVPDLHAVVAQHRGIALSFRTTSFTPAGAWQGIPAPRPTR